jgi:colanic acid/amylovoran biosynthesis protein
MTRILFTNCTCSHHRDCEYNKGSAAVMIGAIKTLKKFIPDAKFTTFVQYSSNFSDRYDLKVIPHNNHQSTFFSFYDSLRSSFNLLRIFLWRLIYDYLGKDMRILINSKDLKEYNKADVIIDLSMDLYSDDFGLISVIEHSKDLLCGVLLKKPVVVYAQSTGPFKTRLTSWLARFTLNKVSLITVREEMAMNHLAEVGVNKTLIRLTADPAFLLDPAPIDRIREIFFKEKINRGDRDFIGLTISPAILTMNIKKSKIFNVIKTAYGMIKYFLPDKLFKMLLKVVNTALNRLNMETRDIDGLESIQDVIDHLTENLDITVVLIPHTRSPESELLNVFGDDATLLKDLYRTKKDNNRVKLICGDYTTEELKGIIGQCDLFIGSKMHANIAALSQCVPTVAIAYSYKFHGIMKMLGQEKYICDGITTENLISKINDAWVNKEKIREELKTKVEFVKERALFNGKLVKDLLDSLHSYER